MKKRRRIEIDAGVYQIGGSELSHEQDASVFLIRCPDQALLIDSGAGKGSEMIWRHIQQLGIAPGGLSALLLTHGHVDHIGKENP